MKKIVDVREYMILAYEPKTFKYLKKCGYNLSPLFFMRIKEHSKLGKMIKKQAREKLK